MLAAIVDPEGIICKEDPDNCVFTLIGEIEVGLPSFQPPSFSVVISNGTRVGDEINLGGMISKLGSGIVILPFIAILQSVAIAKAFGIQIIICVANNFISFT